LNYLRQNMKSWFLFISYWYCGGLVC
jgi:hypothetical protein